MNEDIKRRVFLSGVVGALIGFPFAARFMMKNSSAPRKTHYFSKTLAKYQSLLDVPIKASEPSAQATLRLAPPTGGQWKYVIFSKTFLPTEFSNASNSEPDAFLVREGNLFFNRTGKGQEVFTGGDSLSQVCTVLHTDERTAAEIAVLLKGNRLVPAKPKANGSTAGFDSQFEHLLSLQGQQKTLNKGNRWSEKSGRVKPFDGFSTDYEVVGFDEIAKQQAVKIRFHAKVPNIAKRSGITDRKMESNAVLKNEHHGHAWFDLETGLLVRQEVEMDIACSSPEIAAQNQSGDKLLHVKGNAIVHLFRV